VFTHEFLKYPEPITANVPSELPQLVHMEYFFDTDPGYGNAISVPVTADSLIDMDFNADLSDVLSGFHILYVRMKDELGNWSIVFTHEFLKYPEPIVANVPSELPQMVQIEYFFDTDPGYGNGMNLPISSDSLLSEAFDIDCSLIKTGFHMLHVRVMDDLGNWSLSLTKGFLKFPEPIAVATSESLPQVIEMEYFFDADPGFGNGTPVAINSDSLVEIAFNADFSMLDNGTHNLYLRVKDENGVWSLLYSNSFFKFIPPTPGVLEILPDIVAVEYFFDNDPGFGNGTEILNTTDSIIVENFIADLSMLGPGKHIIYTRVKDANNRWSLSFLDYFCLQGLQVFLEGPYDSISGFMNTNLNDAGLLPLEQPFNSNPTANWFYDGTENVLAIPNVNIVDWLLLQARDATSAENATSATIKENQVGFLLNNGKVVGLDGESFISFIEPIENELYLVVYHRNHLGIMSAFPLNASGDCDLTYSFSLGPNQVYGNENANKELRPGVYGMMSGEGNGNGQITIEDKTVVWKSESGNAGYYSGDFDMNGQVDNPDKNEQWKLNNGKGGDVPD